MLYPKIEDCIAKAGNNKYALVSMVSKRAKDLMVHGQAQNASGKEKQISHAMREVMDSKLAPLYALNQVKQAQ